jgi:putative heme-binding domain-containing protein
MAADVLANDRAGSSAESLLACFLARQGGVPALAMALERNPPARDAARIALRAFVGSGKESAQLQAVLMKAAQLGVDSEKLSPAMLEDLIREVPTQGQAGRGQEIFQRAELGCVVCHSVQGRGGNTGPDLSALGSAQTVDFIVGAILQPQKEIKEGFSAISVSTRDGEEFQGYLVRESPAELVLRDVLRHREVRLLKATIQQRQTIGSIMPAGLADALTRVELRDLVRYLSELGRPK